MLRGMSLHCTRRAWIVAATLALGGCGDDAGSEGTAGPTSTSTPGSTSATSSDTTTTPADTTSGGTNSTTMPGDTTGEVMLCNGWSEDGPDMPWLTLSASDGTPLESGGTFSIECGGQGSWMFAIYPEMGGWEIQSTTLVFDVEVVVEGFPGALGGSFYEDDALIYDVECGSGETFDGGFVHDCIAVFPPDTIADLSELDGAPATIHVELGTQGGDPLIVDLVDMTLSAPAEIVSEDCFF